MIKELFCTVLVVGALTPFNALTDPAPEPDPAEVETLAIVIYQEGGSDAVCDECRYRIADIVLNRVADPRYPDTVEGVVTQRAQYGRLYWTGLKWPDRASSPVEAAAVARAYDVARDVLAGNHSDVYGEGYIYQSEHKQSDDGFYHCGHWFCR